MPEALLTSGERDLALAIAAALLALAVLALWRANRRLAAELEETAATADHAAAQLAELTGGRETPEFAPVGPGPAGGADLALTQNRHGEALATFAPDRVTMIVENRGAGSAEGIQCRLREGRAAVEGGLTGATVIAPGEQGVLAFPIRGSRMAGAMAAGNEIALELSYRSPGDRAPEQRYRAVLRPRDGASHWAVAHER